jgi:hypothetical protein
MDVAAWGGWSVLCWGSQLAQSQDGDILGFFVSLFIAATAEGRGRSLDRCGYKWSYMERTIVLFWVLDWQKAKMEIYCAFAFLSFASALTMQPLKIAKGLGLEADTSDSSSS